MRLDQRFHLSRNEAVRLPGAFGTRLHCIDGTAWITIDGDRRDIVLDSGQSFVVDGDGDVVVFALQGPAAVAVAA